MRNARQSEDGRRPNRVAGIHGALLRRLLAAIEDQSKVTQESGGATREAGASSSQNGADLFLVAQTEIDSRLRGEDANDLTQFKRLLIDDIFSQAWSIAEKLRVAAELQS